MLAGVRVYEGNVYACPVHVLFPLQSQLATVGGTVMS